MEELKNIISKYKEIKVTLGYDIPLSKDTYSKEKASEFISYTIGGEDIDKDECMKEARQTVKELVKDIKLMLKEGGEEIKIEIEELKNTRNPEIDKIRVELSEEKDKVIEKAKVEYLKLREENKELKKQLNKLNK